VLTAVWLRIVTWDVMLHQWVIISSFLEGMWLLHFQVSGDSNLYSRPLRMMPLCSFRISGTDYLVMQHHIQEERYPKITPRLIALQKCVLLDLLQRSDGKMLPKMHSE
jgi:hypothetical protein